MNETLVVCSKCGKTAEYDQARSNSWLIHQRVDAPEGHLVLRCPDHVTQYARRLAGLPQQARTKKVKQNIDAGLWTEYGADDYIASANWQPPDYDQDEYYYISYHHGQMPAFQTATFSTIEQLIAAMREIQPDLRKWKLRD